MTPGRRLRPRMARLLHPTPEQRRATDEALTVLRLYGRRASLGAIGFSASYKERPRESPPGA